MPRVNRERIPGQIWHVTERCHLKQFLSSRQPQWSEALAVGRWCFVERVRRAPRV